MDFESAVRFVDDFQDDDFNTRDSCPGTVNGHKLVHIANQIERRFLRKGKLKHVIFQEEGTRNIWYKNSICNVGVVVMGFSLKTLEKHPKAVPMEHYADLFLGPTKSDEDWKDFRADWLKRNDFELVE